jgi:hypothetical protein
MRLKTNIWTAAVAATQMDANRAHSSAARVRGFVPDPQPRIIL